MADAAKPSGSRAWTTNFWASAPHWISKVRVLVKGGILLDSTNSSPEASVPHPFVGLSFSGKISGQRKERVRIVAGLGGGEGTERLGLPVIHSNACHSWHLSSLPEPRKSLSSFLWLGKGGTCDSAELQGSWRTCSREAHCRVQWAEVQCYPPVSQEGDISLLPMGAHGEGQWGQLAEAIHGGPLFHVSENDSF